MRLIQYAFFVSNQLNVIKIQQIRQFSSLKRLICISVDNAIVKRKFSLHTNMEKSSYTLNADEKFKVSDYYCIGFDLDNTLVKYKLTNLMTLEYDMLAQYMVKVKGYDSKYLMKPFLEDVGLVQRCLFVDCERGNLVKLGSSGSVLKASHGTRFLTETEIEGTYGPGKIWNEGLMYIKDPVEAWRGPLAHKLRPLLDYFDAPSALVFARIIDSIDDSENKPNKYNIWPDILDGLVHMFSPENFDLGQGYFHCMRSDINKYVHAVDPKVVDWLRSLRKSGKKLFLITGSGMGFASLIAEHSLGADWRSLFDIIVSYARKPWFFISSKEDRPFIKLSEPDSLGGRKIFVPELDGNIRYEQGSWDGLSTALFDSWSKENDGKALYIGDNLIQDIYAPVKHTKCQSVAVCEEMGAHMSFEDSDKLVDKAIQSSYWGSFFGNDGVNSVWTEIISKYSKLCVPSINVLAGKPVDFPFKAGYYPKPPSY